MKIGVLGLGSIGMRHAKNIRALGHDVIAYDTNEAVSFRFAGGITRTRDQVFDEADAIVIATPTDDHHDALNNAVQYGKPTLIEKPIAGQLTQELSELVMHTDVPVMVGYNLRFHGVVQKVKQMLDERVIGQVHWAHFCCGQLNERYGDSVVLNWSHEIDLALYLLGPADVDAATLRRRGRIDNADINLVHDNGAISHIHLDYMSKPFMRFGKIAGSLGTISYNLEDVRFVHLSGGDMTYVPGSWDRDYVLEMQAFLDRANGQDTPGATLKDGLAALKIAQDALNYSPAIIT